MNFHFVELVGIFLFPEFLCSYSDMAIAINLFNDRVWKMVCKRRYSVQDVYH
jgi:hypothetical protein